MNKDPLPSVQLRGINFLKFLHIVVQIIFIPIAIGCLKYNFQILLPLPIGAFILLSVLCNFIVFIPHLFENRHNLEILFENSVITITKNKIRRSQSITYDIPKCTVKSGHIHDSLGWSFVFMLGFAWNFYLFSEGIKLLRVEVFYQGLPMFFYGLFTGLLYLLLWFLPDREFVITDYEKNYETILLVPSIYFRFNRNIFSLGKNKITQLNTLLNLKTEPMSKSLKTILKENWLFLFQSCTWLIIWIMGSPFTFDFFHYQFVAAFAFIPLVYNIRCWFYIKSGFKINPLWIYPYWLLTFHEIGIKTWNLTALGVLSPSSIIWTLPISWILYFLVLASTGLELWKGPNIKKVKKSTLIIILAILLIDLGLQITAYFSTLQIIPFYFSFIEIGPLF